MYDFLKILHSTIVTMKTNRYGGLRNHVRQTLRGVSLSGMFFCAILTWIRTVALGKIVIIYIYIYTGGGQKYGNMVNAE